MKTTVDLGCRSYLREQIKPLVAADHLLDDLPALQAHLDEHGYLYLPGFLPREEVLDARLAILRELDTRGCLESDSGLEPGLQKPGAPQLHFMGFDGLPYEPPLRRVLEHPKLFALYGRLFGDTAVTYSYKWLRPVAPEGSSGFHVDRVYMGRGSERVMTTWIPFGDLDLSDGVLAICPRSQRSAGFASLRDTYGRIDVDRDRLEGWFSRDPDEIAERFGGVWHASPVQAGDIITFGLDLLHGSTVNRSPRYRLSCDVRFQPAGEPIDDRWGGDDPHGHERLNSEALTPIEEVKASWGF